MTSAKDFYVVGIGASAGGLEAIEAFFSKVQPDSGLAYVIVQHLSPDYKSLMPEILSKRTSLNVYTAEDGMKVELNNVYLIPRKMNMKIFQAKLHLTEKVPTQLLNLPIDIFLNSLAEDFEDKAIAVILSGTGSDGSRGIRMVKENGGIVIVQDPEDAKFDGMPKSAITTGTVDFILPPQEIPDKILSYVKHPYILEKDRNSELSLVPEDYMSKIILILKDAFGLDFTHYKDTTISRRIERRLSINQIDNLKDYLEYLSSSKNEQSTLYKELLIGVTKFFRDTEAFQIIENEIIPNVFKSKNPKDEIRIWVSACSTGEEAYSIAILFKEYMLANKLNNEIKIFATDIDKSSIEFASYGVYSASVTADVSSKRLNKFFNQLGEGYRISDNIREMIVFATQNVIKDPPFNKIDFLTCRNLLIYFQPSLQQKVLAIFNFALNKNGYMFLGNSETIGEMEAYFEIVNHKWKIYKSLRSGRLNPESYNSKFPGNIAISVPAKKPIFALKNAVADLINIFTEKILNDNAPTTVVVNENYSIINSFGNLNELLALPNINKVSDGFDFDITKMVPPNLKLTFSIAINKAIKSQEEVIHYNIKYQKNNKENFLVDLVFSPLLRPDLNTKFVIIYFQKRDKIQPVSQEIKSFQDIDVQVQQRLLDLENELKHSRENLQASIEELETTNEELQSTNEELISANEELQSTNEELQSVNEELYTVNTEFQAKNHDLVVMNNDMENLLQNTDEYIIFLDLELSIRKFTNNITEIFNLKANDQNRPISDITHHVSGINLYNEIQPVLKSQLNVHKIVQAKNKWYEMNIRPYVTRKGFIEGIVLSFINVTELIIAQQELKESEERFKGAFETASHGFALLDIHGKFFMINPAICKMFGYSKEEMLTKSFRDITHNEDFLKGEELLKQLFEGKIQFFHLQKRYLHKNGDTIWASVNVSVVRNVQNNPVYTVAQIIDITEKIKAEDVQINRLNRIYDIIQHYSVTKPQKKPLVFYTDDSRTDLEYITEVLQMQNYDVKNTTSGLKLLEMVKTEVPDIFLLDVIMPEITGFEICKKLKSMPETRDIPVVFLTGKSDRENIIKGFKLGAVDYILKPVNKEELIARINAHLEIKLSREKLLELNTIKDKFIGYIANEIKHSFSSEKMNIFKDKFHNNLDIKQILEFLNSKK